MKLLSTGRVIPWLVSTTLLLSAASPALAQAWVPDRKQGAVFFSYQRLDVQHHLFSAPLDPVTLLPDPNGTTSVDMGQIYSNTTILSMDYGLTRKLAISGNLAYVSAKYDGTFPENPSLDNGQYQGTMQDFMVQMRYMTLDRPLAVTPFGQVRVPTHNYETLGHVAAGSGLNEYTGGIALGEIFGRAHPTYVQTAGSFSIFQRHEEHQMKRTNVLLEIGNFTAQWLTFRAFGTWQHTVGGEDWIADTDTEAGFHDHDMVANANYYGAGAGVTFTLNSKVDLSLSYSEILQGSNTHDAKALILGTSFSFGGPVHVSASRRALASQFTRIAALN